MTNEPRLPMRKKPTPLSKIIPPPFNYIEESDLEIILGDTNLKSDTAYKKANKMLRFSKLTLPTKPIGIEERWALGPGDNSQLSFRVGYYYPERSNILLDNEKKAHVVIGRVYQVRIDIYRRKKVMPDIEFDSIRVIDYINLREKYNKRILSSLRNLGY